MSLKLKSIKKWLGLVKVAVSVAKTVLTGKPAKTLDKIERGIEIGEKALEIADLSRQPLPNSPQNKL